jgi:putative DNA primase/helicase
MGTSNAATGGLDRRAAGARGNAAGHRTASVSHIDQFRAAMERHGITAPDNIIDDGQLHRWGTNGKSRDDAGWYVLHGDGVPAGAFGDFRAGVSETFRADIGRELTDEEQRAQRERIEAIRRQREADEARRQAEAADWAQRTWDPAAPAPTDHPYLVRKGVKPHGLRIYRGDLVIREMPCDGALIVPLGDSAGRIQTLEFIAADGEKRFLPGGRKSGAYFAIGKPNGVVIIAEGFATGASVHEATGHAVAIGFDAGNLRSVAEGVRRKFPEGRIILAGDNDASSTGQRAAEDAARAVHGLLATPATMGMDWNDVALAAGAEAVKAGLAAAWDPAASSDHQGSIAAPRPLPDGLPSVEAFDYELLPPILRARVEDIAERMQCPPDYPAVALIVILSSMIGRRCGIAPKRSDDWTVIPNLWGAVIGRPGVMKSPPLTEIMKPLQVLQARAVEHFEREQGDYQAGELVSAEAERVAKDAIRKFLKDGKTAAAHELAQETLQRDSKEPVCRRYVVNDATVEKLGEILNENPCGVLLYRDELNGFFRILERQGHEADRAFYLEAWNGDGSFTYDRIGRGTIHIAACCLSIIGSIQPGPLSDLVRGLRGSGDDGLLQRFQLAVWPDLTRTWRNVDRAPDIHAREAVQQIIDRLGGLNADGLESEPGAVRALRFTDEAQDLFNVWREALELRLRGEIEHPMLEAHLAKYRSLVPSLALVLHLTEVDGGPVEKLALERAIAWAEYLESHARRIYAPAISPDMDAARALLVHVRKGDLGAEFALRDIYNRGWSGLGTRDEAAAAVAVLEDYGWMRAFTEETEGRPRTVYRINPNTPEQSA